MFSFLDGSYALSHPHPSLYSPTCSLEVAAKTSALSRWTGKPLIKELNFELSFDDPRLGPDQRIVIKGDRPQLDALATAVNDYVQGFLQDLSPDLVWLPQAASVYGYHNTPGQTVATLPQPQLVTQGLLSHTLHLGRLATKESGPTLQLNATQLHDLAEALETYQTDMVALPSLTASQQRRTVTRWGRSPRLFSSWWGLVTPFGNSNKSRKPVVP